MRRKHQQTLLAMLARPTPSDIRWADIESMMAANGVEITERSGSRVLLKKGADRIVVHRPHPKPTTGRATVRDVAAFLTAVGVKP
jgi:HicA toxin of bacterial toxin-antitoxin,